MKKALLILIAALICIPSWSQSLSTVKGKTKDGKTLQVKYYHGANEDYIESVQYQLIDELQSKVNKLQSDTKDLQNRLDAANKRNKETSESSGKSTNEQVSRLQKQVNQNEKEIQSLNQEISRLTSQLDSLTAKSASEKALMQNTINDQKQYITEIGIKQSNAPKKVKAPFIGLEGSFGQVVPVKSVNENWDWANQTGLQFDLYFGMPLPFKAVPVAVECGMGMRHFGMSTAQGAHTHTKDCIDYDHFGYQAIYSYSDLQEKLSLTYIDIPIRVSIGCPVTNQVTVYAKIGVTPSINIGSNYETTGSYSVRGYYPKWGVLLENIAELGFANDLAYGEAGSEPSINKFVLWGNLDLGAHMPIGRTPIQVNAGVKLDYSLMSIGTAQKSDKHPEGRGLLEDGGKVLLPGLNIGVVYILK